jgi:hypothetical protein
MRIFALSDLHVDYPENLAWLVSLSRADYTEDALLVAGDISHDEDLLCRAMETLRSRFRSVFFVPGNHDVWLRGSGHVDSLNKFHALMARCRALGVETAAQRADAIGPWIVPLHAWYVQPHEGAESLYVEKEGEDLQLRMWADKRAVRWPRFEGHPGPASYFLSLNDYAMPDDPQAPVITFSHFLPRPELMFWTEEEFAATGLAPVDPQPRFNFSRVAGCRALDHQLRDFGSKLHVYGHQHRNRDRLIDGVRYVSHCLGYPREREQGRVRGVGNGPLLIWER